jgi:hypothetical protein
VHEAVHAGLHWFEHIKEPLTYYGEALPYLIDYIFTKCKEIVNFENLNT